MQRSVLGGLLGATLAILLGLLWLGSRPDEAEPIRAAGSAAVPASGRPAVAVRDVGVEGLALSDASGRASASESGLEEPGELELGGEYGTLWVTARSTTTGAPIAGLELHLIEAGQTTWRMQSVGEARGGIGEPPTTNAEGRAEFAVPPNQAHRLVVLESNSAGAIVSGQTGIDAPIFAGPKTLEVVFELPTEAGPGMFGRVIAADTGSPLTEAEVALVAHPSRWNAEADGMQRDEQRTSAALLEVDEEGYFEIPPRAFAKLEAAGLIELRAPGYGVKFAMLRAGCERRAQALEIILGRAATLSVLVLDARGQPAEEATVALSGESYLNLQEGGTIRMQTAAHVVSGTTDRDGRILFDQLAAGVEFQVKFRFGDGPWFQGAQVQLARSERRELTLAVGGGATVTGVLIDTDGGSAQGVELWIKAVDQLNPRMLRERDDQFLGASAGPGGHFSFHDVPDGLWVVGPAPGGAYPPLGHPVAVEAGLPDRDLRLELSTKLTVSGVVLDPFDEPAANAAVRGSGEGMFVNTRSDSEGRFTLGPLVAGELSLSAWGGAYASSKWIDAAAGGADVVLRLRQGGTLRGVLLDAESGAPLRGSIACASTDGSLSISGQARADGSFQFPGLVPGEYSVSGQGAGKIGIQDDVVLPPGGDVAVELRAVPSASLLLKYVGPDPVEYFDLARDGKPWATYAIERGDAGSVLVPPGRLTVTSKGLVEGAPQEVEFDLASGDRRKVTFGWIDSSAQSNDK